eukprot:snap_masked-scaffold_1-processed-gene-31.21-mRNA-1 protein AED:0.00 eAED:0.00 QI:40/1/1/1/0.5/0.4/5/34/480
MVTDAKKKQNAKRKRSDSNKNIQRLDSYELGMFNSESKGKSYANFFNKFKKNETKIHRKDNKNILDKLKETTAINLNELEQIQDVSLASSISLSIKISTKENRRKLLQKIDKLMTSWIIYTWESKTLDTISQYFMSNPKGKETMTKREIFFVSEKTMLTATDIKSCKKYVTETALMSKKNTKMVQAIQDCLKEFFLAFRSCYNCHCKKERSKFYLQDTDYLLLFEKNKETNICLMSCSSTRLLNLIKTWKIDYDSENIDKTESKFDDLDIKDFKNEDTDFLAELKSFHASSFTTTTAHLSNYTKIASKENVDNGSSQLAKHCISIKDSFNVQLFVSALLNLYLDSSARPERLPTILAENQFPLCTVKSMDMFLEATQKLTSNKELMFTTKETLPCNLKWFARFAKALEPELNEERITKVTGSFDYLDISLPLNKMRTRSRIADAKDTVTNLVISGLTLKSSKIKVKEGDFSVEIKTKTVS